MDDSSTYLVAALNNQVELLTNKLFEKDKKIEKLESEISFTNKKIKNIVKLLRDHEIGFRFDANIRKTKDFHEPHAAEDCQMASNICKDVADKLESEEDFIYYLTDYKGDPIVDDND